MKHTSKSYAWKSIVLVVVLIILNNVVEAQDTVKVTPVDTTVAVAAPACCFQRQRKKAIHNLRGS